MGPYHVGYMQHVFNHTTPNDPTTPGTFMLATIYYPTRQIPNTTFPYLDSISASIFESTIGLTPGVLSNLTTRLQFQAPTLLDTHSAFGNATSPYPSLVFTPGAGLPASSYTAYLSELASYGYAIIAIDHPGEAPYLPLSTINGTHGVYGYPDFTNFPPTLNETFGVLDYRVSDTLAVVSEEFFPKFVRQHGLPFNTTHLGVFGHSIGGAAAAAVMASKSDDVGMFKVGANLDGSYYQVANATGGIDMNVPAPDLKHPFFELASEVHFFGNASGPGDGTWKYFNDAQSGWLRDVQVMGSRHLDFSDIPLWIDLLDQRAVLNQTWVGPVDAARMTHLVNALLKEFFGSIQGEGLEGVDEWVSQAPELVLLEETGA
jgi:pimeloyl-ACP methyl ester carboxylesterase